MIPSPVEEHLLKKRLVFLCIVMATKSSGLFPSCTRQQVEPESLLLACSLRVKVPFAFRSFFSKSFKKGRVDEFDLAFSDGRKRHVLLLMFDLS